MYVGPHEFRALRRRDASRDDGRCRACFRPRSAHPVTGWVEARPVWNMRKADRA